MNIDFSKRVRVIRPHSGPEHRHCMFYPGNWRERPDIVYRDAIGRKGHATYGWLPLICSMSMECDAEVLVRRDLLDDIAQAAMEDS